MTPELAETIFYNTYEELRQSHETGVKPLDQRELRLKSWQSVIDAIQEDYIRDQAIKYLVRNDPAGAD